MKRFFITSNINLCFCWYCSWWGFFLVFSYSWIYNPYTFTSPLYQTLKQNYRDSHNCYSVKNMAFLWLLDELLLETEWSEVIIWWFVSIKLIKYFFIFSFLISLFKWSIHCKNCPFSIYRYHYGSMVLFFLCFFFIRKAPSFCFFVHFLNKVVKIKYKTPFSKLYKGYICHIFLK